MYLEEDLKKGESVVTGKDVPKTKEEALEKGYELDKED